MTLALARTSDSSLIVRLAAALGRLTGWRRALAAALLGVATTAALPPIGAVPLLVVGFTGLVWLIDGAPRGRTAFWTGWWFGLGFFVSGLYWIANALLIDAAAFWWMVPFAVFGLPAFLGIFTGAATAASWALASRGVGRVFALASLWAAAEFARGHVLTGFPWNLIGYGWMEIGPVLQAASVIGAYGLSWLTVLLAALPATLAEPGASGWQPGRRGPVALGCGLALLVLVAGAGAWRLAQAPDPHDPAGLVPDVRLRLVQPNIAQRFKWLPSERANSFRRLLELSRSPAEGPPTVIIWPEASTPFLLEREPEARAAAAAVVPPDGLLIAGTPRATGRADGGYELWNGMIALDHEGTIRGSYDKFHLVPFGEYVPMRNLLPIGKITPGQVDFSAGPGPRTLRLPGLPPVSPMICYEIIFPGRVTDPADRPAWLLALTNDGWYGYSTGPYQHFAMAAMRAVEEGMPMVRDANTGVSGVVDPYGRVIARLGLEQAGVVDAPLPRALATPTPFERYGDWFLAALLLVGLAVGIAGRRPAG